GERGGGFKGGPIELLETAATRVDPPCPFFGPCGGCALQHLEDAAYAAWKADQLAVALQRKGLAPETLHPLRRVAPGRRRRITWSAKRTARGVLIGYYERQSHQLADVTTCLLVTPALDSLLTPLRALLERVLAVAQEARLTALESETGIDLLIDSRHALTADDREALAAFAEVNDLARL